jgi:hypothetical protein
MYKLQKRRTLSCSPRLHWPLTPNQPLPSEASGSLRAICMDLWSRSASGTSSKYCFPFIFLSYADQRRFNANELIDLAVVLQLPDPLITSTSFCSDPIESIGLLCACLRSPEDQWSLATMYACPQSAISEIITTTAGFINKWLGFLLRWDADGILSPNMLCHYADALYAHGAPTLSLYSFINCTI